MYEYLIHVWCWTWGVRLVVVGEGLRRVVFCCSKTAMTASSVDIFSREVRTGENYACRWVQAAIACIRFASL